MGSLFESVSQSSISLLLWSNYEIIDLIGDAWEVFLSLSVNHLSLYYFGMLKDSIFNFYAKKLIC